MAFYNSSAQITDLFSLQQLGVYRTEAMGSVINNLIGVIISNNEKPTMDIVNSYFNELFCAYERMVNIHDMPIDIAKVYREFYIAFSQLLTVYGIELFTIKDIYVLDDMGNLFITYL